jgi:hypothetical protein
MVVSMTTMAVDELVFSPVKWAAPTESSKSLHDLSHAYKFVVQGAVIAESLPHYELEKMMSEENGLPVMARGVDTEFEKVATTALMASLEVPLFISLVQMRTSNFSVDIDQSLGKGHWKLEPVFKTSQLLLRNGIAREFAESQPAF